MTRQVLSNPAQPGSWNPVGFGFIQFFLYNDRVDPMVEPVDLVEKYKKITNEKPGWPVGRTGWPDARWLNRVDLKKNNFQKAKGRIRTCVP